MVDATVLTVDLCPCRFNSCLEYKKGPVAEWLGGALQKLIQRFDSVQDLKQRPQLIWLEQLTHNQRVTSSNLVGRTKFIIMLLLTIILLIETILSITYLYTLARRIERLEDEISELKTRHTKLLLKG